MLRINLQIKEMVLDSKDMVQKQAIFTHQIEVLKKNKARIEYELQAVKDSQIDNVLMRDSLENLLNIIPEQITLSLVQIQNGMLIIKGNTPTKELFIFLLQDPLKAIFGESKVNFTELSNGSYDFTSQNKANDLFIKNEPKKGIK